MVLVQLFSNLHGCFNKFLIQYNNLLKRKGEKKKNPTSVLVLASYQVETNIIYEEENRGRVQGHEPV